MPHSHRHGALAAGLVALLVVVAVLAAGLAQPAPAQAAGVCDALHTGPIPNPAQLACDVGSSVVEKGPVGAVGDVLTAPVRAIGDEVMKGITTWVVNGASWLVGQAGKLIDATTTPRITSRWFTGQYQAMAALAVVFALPLLLLSVMQAVIRRDGQLLTHAVCVSLPLAFFMTAMAVTLTQLGLEITDQASAQIAGSVGGDAKQFFGDTTKALKDVSGSTAIPLFAAFLGALILAVGAFFVWIELLLRSAAIYVCLLFLPLTFVGLLWPQTASWARRLAWTLVALILSQFVIVAIMALAAAGLGQSRGDEAFQGVLAGAALMMLAAFSPIVLLRLVPLAEAAVDSGRHRAGVGAQTLGPMASPGMVMRRMLDANWGGGAGGGGLHAAPAGASAGGAGIGAAGGGGRAGAAGGAVAGAATVAGAAGAAGAMGGAARSHAGSGGAAARGASNGRGAGAGGGGVQRPPTGDLTGTGAPGRSGAATGTASQPSTADPAGSAGPMPTSSGTGAGRGGSAGATPTVPGPSAGSGPVAPSSTIRGGDDGGALGASAPDVARDPVREPDPPRPRPDVGGDR